MDAEKLHNGVESIKHPFQTGILAVRGLGHALEKRGGPISSQLGAGFVELVDPEVSILNLHNWGNTDREISAAQPTNFGEPWQPSVQVTVASVVVPDSLAHQ